MELKTDEHIKKLNTKGIELFNMFVSLELHKKAPKLPYSFETFFNLIQNRFFIHTAFLVKM